MALQLANLLWIDRAHHVNDGKLLGIGGYYDHTVDAVAGSPQIDFDVLARMLGIDADDPGPGRRLQLIADRLYIRIRVLAVLFKFKALHVNALESRDDLLDLCLVCRPLLRE